MRELEWEGRTGGKEGTKEGRSSVKKVSKSVN